MSKIDKNRRFLQVFGLILGVFAFSGGVWAQDAGDIDGFDEVDGGVWDGRHGEDGGHGENEENGGPLGLVATPLHSYRVPLELGSSIADFQSDAAGRTFSIVTSAGPESSEQAANGTACVVIGVDGHGARAMTYRYQGQSTACLSFMLHPQGGILLRGSWQRPGTPPPNSAVNIGFTALLSEDGEELWVVDDEQLLDAEGVSEQGTGEYRGEYMGAHPALAYDAEADLLLAFSEAELRGAGNHRFSQAHVIEATSGTLRVSGLTVDKSGTLQSIQGAAYRPESGDFIIVTSHPDSAYAGLNLFSYNGRRTIKRLEIQGDQWDGHWLGDIVQPHDGPLLLVSGLPNARGTDLNAVSSNGDILWSYRPGASLKDDERQESGEGDGESLSASGIWASGKYVLVLVTDPDSGRRVEIVSIETGELLGHTRLSALNILGPVKFAGRGDGTFAMLSMDYLESVADEYLIEIAPEQDGDEGGEDAAGPGDLGDDGLVKPSQGGDDGCSVASASRATPSVFGLLSSGLLALGLLVINIASRRRARA